MLFNSLSCNELNKVHEFYEVLDSQILKLFQDQEIKFKKTLKLRQLSFELIKENIIEVYRQKSDKNRENNPLNRKVENKVKVEVYGSMATGLAIDSSDLDILVLDYIDQDSPRFHFLSRNEMIEEMQMLHEALDKVFALKSNVLIQSASVPVIKLKLSLVELCEREKLKDPNFEIDPSDLM